MTNTILVGVCVVGAQIYSAAGHAALRWPSPLYDAGGEVGLASGHQCDGGGCLFFNNFTFVPDTVTKRMSAFSPARTYGFSDPLFFAFRTHPWAAPGTAKMKVGGGMQQAIFPCGVFGGNPYGCPAGDPKGHICPGGGAGFGQDARLLPFKNAVSTKWKRGTVVEAGWGLKANHGGGYSYRLCKVPKEGGYVNMDEECFQRTQLEFHGDVQYVQWGMNVTSRVGFKGTFTRQNTFPVGSQWARNPVPPCKGYDGGYNMKGCAFGYQFKPPVPGIAGFGENANDYDHPFQWSIIDLLEVPLELETGEYLLSWVWNCEQTPQVWTSCSKIEIV